jgi:hypothetical protein
VYEKGEIMTNPDISLVLCQLAQPNPNNPVYAIGIEPTGLARALHFCAPTDLHRTLTPHFEQRTVVNVTPKYSLVDLHIGESNDSGGFLGSRN